MSVPPPNNSATLGIFTERLKSDKDLHAGLFTLKRVIIQTVLSVVSFIIAISAACLIEWWLHFIFGKMTAWGIPIAPLAETALPYVSAGLLFGLSVIATILAFREAWHIGRHSADSSKLTNEHSVVPMSHITRDSPVNAHVMSRAERRRQNRR